MFFEKPTAVIFLKSTSLDVYILKEDRKTLSFTEDSIKHLEVVSREKLAIDLNSTLKELKPQKGFLVLSDEVIFQKTVPLTEGNNKTQIEEFFDKIPFDATQIARKEIPVDKQVYLFSTNKELYRSIIEVFTALSWKIEKVIPAGIFPAIAQNSSLSSEEIEQILENTEILEKANFMDQEEYVVDNANESEIIHEQEETNLVQTKKSVNIKLIVFGLIILTVIFGFAFAAYQYREGFKQQHSKTEAQKIIESSINESQPISLPSATPIPFKKEELKIQVLNGSGISGQAGKIKVGLEKIGFKNIDTGNYAFDNIPETIATYSANVSSENKGEIQKVLDETFGKVTISEASSTARFDVNITTGTKIIK